MKMIEEGALLALARQHQRVSSTNALDWCEIDINPWPCRTAQLIDSYRRSKEQNAALVAALNAADARFEGLVQYAHRYGEKWVIFSANAGRKELASVRGDA